MEDIGRGRANGEAQFRRVRWGGAAAPTPRCLTEPRAGGSITHRSWMRRQRPPLLVAGGLGKSLEARVLPPQLAETLRRGGAAAQRLGSLLLALRKLLPLGPYYCLVMPGVACPRQLLQAWYSTAEPSSCSSSGS